jgi:hypothetical protein
MEAEKKTFKQKAENEFKELGFVCGYLFLVFAAAIPIAAARSRPVR